MSDPLAAVKAACARAVAAARAGQPAELADALTEAERRCELHPDRPAALRELAFACWEAERLAEAERHLGQAAEGFAAAGQPLEAARCRANLGLLAKQGGNYSAALFLLDAVRPAFEELASPLERARLDLNRASLCIDLGRYAEARAEARAAGNLLAAHGDTLEAGRARWIDAAAAEGLRLYQEALDLYRGAAELLEAAGARDEVAQVAINVGEVYRRIGDHALALRAYEEARESLGPAESGALATLELNRAAALAGAGRDDEALTALDAATATFARLGFDRDRAEADLLRARLLLARSDLPAAQAVLLDARQQLARDGTPHDAAPADLLLAELGLALSNPTVVEMTCRTVLEQVPPALADLHQRAWRQLMRLAARRGDPEAELDCGRRAVEALERLGAGVRHDLLRHRFDVSPDHEALYGAVLRLLADRGDAAEALDLMQRAKARALVQSGGEPPPALDMDPAWQAEERAAAEAVNALLAEADGIRADRPRYAAWQDQLETARARLTDLHLRLASQAPDAALLRGVLPEPVTPARVSELLGPRALLIEAFVAGDDLYLAACCDGEAGVVAKLGAMPRIARLLDRFHAGLAMLAGATIDLLPRLLPGLQLGAEADGQALYEELVAPFEDWLDAADLLVLAPHGRLWEVPPAVLHDGLEPLAARLATSLVPSAASLLRLAARQPGRGTGGVAIAGDQERLAAVAGEVASSEHRTVLAGSRATREAVLGAVGGAREVHFAGHAEFEPANPLFSSLRLAGEQRVTAADLYAVRLRADLVTLAGCETGRRRGIAAPELAGLARALLYAGARCVAVSLWPVPDAATAHLMGCFARARAAGEPVAEALRLAQDEVRRAVLHPFYWGGFALVGAPNGRPREDDRVES